MSSGEWCSGFVAVAPGECVLKPRWGAEKALGSESAMEYIQLDWQFGHDASDFSWRVTAK